MDGEERPAPTAEGDPDTPLRSYLVAKQSVAQLLREVGQLAEHSAPWAAERVHHLMVRLAEDRFQLVVVGQFKRGKTSLMNAIIGRPLLPTGTIPVTSVVTTLRYGQTVRAVIRRVGQAIDEQIPVSGLSEFITERGNPGNRKHVLSAEIEVPAPFLRRGLHFIDTPGIGSAHEQNTATTLAFLPEADAAIFVTGADGPLSESELGFLDAVRQHVRKLFFVLNKIDQLSESDRDEVLPYTSRLLAQRLGVEDIRLFPVSATKALSVETTDAEALVDSGIPALEASLATFLNDDRRSVFLVAVLDRAVRLLEETRFALDLRQRAAVAPDAAQKTTALNQRYEEQEGQRRAIVDRAAQVIRDWEARVLDPALEQFAAQMPEVLTADVVSALQSWSNARDGEDTSRTWLRKQLQERGIAWLRSMVTPIGEASLAMASEVEAKIAALIDDTFHIAGSVFGMVTPTDATPHRDQHEDKWHWAPPCFNLPDTIRDLGDIADDSSRLPLPHSTAVRGAARRITHRIPQEVDKTRHALRDVVLRHLRSCVDDLDTSSTRALAEERTRVQVAITPNEPLKDGAQDDAELTRGLQPLLTRLTTARDALLHQDSLEQVSSQTDLNVDPTVKQQSQTMTQDTVAPTKQPRVVTGTCTICAAVADAVFDLLCHHQYAIAVDRSTQQHFVASHGLCPTHTWHLERVASPRGLSASYPSLLDETATRMQAMVGLPTSGLIDGIEGLLSNQDRCPACLRRSQAEHAVAERLVHQIETPQGRSTFLRSQWVCLTHLQLLLTAVDDNAAADLLRGHARRLIELAESMREYVLKSDARRRALLTDHEVRAYRQALVLLVGERYLVATVPEE